MTKRAKQVVKWFTLPNGDKVGKWCGHTDVRGFRCPKGYSATAFTPEKHPITKEPIPYQWWILLKNDATSLVGFLKKHPFGK